MLKENWESAGNFRESSTLRKNPLPSVQGKLGEGGDSSEWRNQDCHSMWQTKASLHYGTIPAVSPQGCLRTEFSGGRGHRLHCNPVYSGTEQIQMKRPKRTHSRDFTSEECWELLRK